MKCLFVYNPKSGKGKILKHIEYITKTLFSIFKDVLVYPSQAKGDIENQIMSNCSDIDAVVVAGGDGSISEAVNGILHCKKKIYLGILPFGTVNDVAHSLNIPCNYKKALKVIEKQNLFKHDIIKAGDHYGIYVLGGGLFTETSYNTSQRTKKKLGKIAYVLHGLKKFFKTPQKNIVFILNDGTEIENPSFFLFVNSKSVAGQKIDKGARLNDGVGSLVIIKNKKNKVGLTDLIKIIKLFLFGIDKFKGKTIYKQTTSNFKISCENDFNYNLDGECLTAKSIDVEIVKEGINIFI